MTSPQDVAAWLFESLKAERYLYQDVAVDGIALTFGEGFVYENDSGNLAIDRRVLKEFKKLTRDLVVWERGEKVWRFREAYDPPGRQADI